MDAVLALLRRVRSLRTERGLSQTAEVAEAVIQVEDRELLRRLESMVATVRGATHVRVVTFEPASANTKSPGWQSPSPSSDVRGVACPKPGLAPGWRCPEAGGGSSQPSPAART